MTGKKLYHSIAKSIMDMIDTGAYPPGTRLPGERELAAKFGVSRVVIREAEIVLETIGRLDARVRSGMYVRDQSKNVSSALPNVTPFELTQTRLLFESECAALAATQITDEQLEDLRKTIDLMAEPSNGAPDGEDADRAFHLQIASASGNLINVFLFEKLWRMRTEIPTIKIAYESVCSSDASRRVNEHSEILAALTARDPVKARNAMRRHFERLLEALLDASEQQAIVEARKRSDVIRERYLRLAMEQ